MDAYMPLESLTFWGSDPHPAGKKRVISNPITYKKTLLHNLSQPNE